MAHRFDELFEVQGSSQDLDIRVNSRRIKLIEDTIKNAINKFATNSGIEITAVDISEIHFHDKIKDKITEERVSQIDAKAIVTRARARAQEMILKGQGEGEARAAFFREVLGELKKESVMANTDMVASIIRHLIDTMVSMQDLKSFVRATTLIEQPSFKRLGAGETEVKNGNGGTGYSES